MMQVVVGSLPRTYLRGVARFSSKPDEGNLKLVGAGCHARNRVIALLVRPGELSFSRLILGQDYSSARDRDAARAADVTLHGPRNLGDGGRWSEEHGTAENRNPQASPAPYSESRSHRVKWCLTVHASCKTATQTQRLVISFVFDAFRRMGLTNCESTKSSD